MDYTILFKYFDGLSPHQQEQIKQLFPLYTDWNAKINVISRKDMDEFYIRHVLHSLAIAKFITFKPQTKVWDIGSGGGFPGIPLAILFPEVQFTIMDSIQKKIKVAQTISQELGLENTTFLCERAENHQGTYDFIVSRAVTQMPVFLQWIQGKISTTSKNDIPNGIIALKGGDVSQEFEGITHTEIPIQSYFTEDFFETKKILIVPNMTYIQ